MTKTDPRNRSFLRSFGMAASALGTALLIPCCGGGGGDGAENDSGNAPSDAITAGKFLILGTRTDQADAATAKKNAENTLIKYPDIDGMVGLWAYNAPQCMEALKDAGRIGEVAIVSFDEADATLQGIKDGHIHATVVQQPYQFGYQSVQLLHKLHMGAEVEVPEDQQIMVPTQVVRAADVDEFWGELRKLSAAGELAMKNPSTAAGAAKFVFVPNGPDPFWNYAAAGCASAAAELGVTCDFRTPHDGSSGEQNKIFENIIQAGDYAGASVSPLDPPNQGTLLDQVAASTNLICNDSDAPDTQRLFYLGTNNYEAGREAGKLVKEALPEGGKIMIFVGKLDVLNAQQRRQGLIDELAAE